MQSLEELCVGIAGNKSVCSKLSGWQTKQCHVHQAALLEAVDRLGL